MRKINNFGLSDLKPNFSTGREGAIESGRWGAR